MKSIDNRYRMKQLILYIADRLKGADHFGATKLNKVLYRADHEAFRLLGRKITTFRYQKNKRGPTLCAFQHLTEEMQEEGLLSWEVRPKGELNEKRPVALVEPDHDVFTAGELKVIDREIERAYASTGSEVSDEEHRTAAWFATKTGETILPKLTLVEDPGVIIPLSDAEQERVRIAVERFRARAAGL